MAQLTPQEILARLAKSPAEEQPAQDPWVANASHPDAVAKGRSQAQGMPVSDATGDAEDKLSGLLDRINSITATASSAEQVEQIVQQDRPCMMLPRYEIGTCLLCRPRTCCPNLQTCQQDKPCSLQFPLRSRNDQANK